MGCTFCAIPQFRGKHRSRPLADVVKEVEGLAARGVQEAILVSQDTLAYGRDIAGNGDIGDLLLALGEDTRMPWIRPMYLHPAHVNERVLDKFARARIVPYVDMPVQHGDDGVLRAMRRAVTARRMLEIVRQFREAIADVTLRTTVLVGFPGETPAAFENLLRFLDDARFDRLGVFTYSPEEGTPSPAFPDQIDAETAADRAPVAPGPGAGGATVLVLWRVPFSQAGLVLFFVAVTVIGTWAADRAERALGVKDPGAIVIDEVAGMTLSVLALPRTPLVLLLAFVLFRVFDIVKPPPARQAQALPGGFGVLVDDLVAGLYALVVVAALRTLFGWP